MTSPALHFLGWDRPATTSVCDYLLADARPGAPFDLAGTLLVVPTQQAGRHLLDALVLRCHEAGAAVLSQRVITPTQLAADTLLRQDLASGAEVLTAWHEVFAAADEALLITAFGASGRSREPAVTIPLAERLQQVRRTLAEGGCSCAGSATAAVAADMEPERWQAFAQLEAAYLARLAAVGLRDPCAAEIAWATQPQLAPEVRRVIVACVPDPSLLLIHALQRLAEQVAITVLVQAPPAEAAAFDLWGRPLPDVWQNRQLPIPDEEQNLLPAADPADQASRIVAILHQEAGRFSVADTAIGVPDRATIPFLLQHLDASGVRAFDPQEHPLREHPLCELIQLLLELRRAVPYRTIADLLRHPDVLAALSHGAPPATAAALLTQLDTFQNRHLPLGLPDLLRPFAHNPRGTTDRHADFTLLGQVLPRLASWRERLAAPHLPAALRTLLGEIYAQRELHPERPADRLFAAAAETLDRLLREQEDTRLTPATAEIETAVLSARLRSQGFAPERNDEALDLVGWLELPWNQAPLLLVAGMNEGCVPDGHLADDFLPDALRRTLGLRDDRLRAARDAFLLHVLLAARADGRGRVCLLSGKCSAEGDPLRPSRLLFRCPDAQLPARALRLFGALPVTRPDTPATIGFRLRPPAPAVGAPPATLSVTLFKDYLRCPFRFYLRHRLQMAPLADDHLAPDERAFGTLVHRALQDFSRDARLTSCTDAALLTTHLTEFIRVAFRVVYGVHPSLAVQVALATATQRLARFAELQAALAQEWEIVSCEERFVLRRGGCDIVARIDRIDRHRQDGRWRVMDYKTFDKARTPTEGHLGPCRLDTPAFAQCEMTDTRGRLRRKGWEDLQLPLYREAMRASGRFAEAPLELGYFILPRAVGETGFYPWSDYTDALHDSALTCTDGVLVALTAGRFWPPREVNPDWDDFAALFPGDPTHCFEPPATPP
ncbi:MAG: PD-(D/E)XK nuclease family protein [Kiritimatiellia bacterium]